VTFTFVADLTETARGSVSPEVPVQITGSVRKFSHALASTLGRISFSERADRCRLLQQPDVVFVLRLPLWSARNLPFRLPRTNDWSKQRPCGVNPFFYYCFGKRLVRNVARPTFSRESPAPAC